MIQQHTRGNAKKARTRQQLLKPECYGSRTNEQRLVLKRLSVAGVEVIGDNADASDSPETESGVCHRSGCKALRISDGTDRIRDRDLLPTLYLCRRDDGRS